MVHNFGWSEELLKLEIAELDEADFNLDLMGFGDEELERLLNGEGDNTLHDCRPLPLLALRLPAGTRGFN